MEATTAVKDPRSLTKTELRRLFNAADAAGKTAAKGTTPVAMVVGSPTTAFGTDIDPAKPVYVVPGGVCGFAWVRITPANSRAAHYATAHWDAHPAYHGGVSIFCHDYGQSMTLKEAYADAFAKVLREAGIRAYGESRMD
jgi:hypothetical protein